ncbi:MAG: amidoligase family protein [Balneolaceae bacterium]|nr:amidoligase family protein [Balneolaceae bacterium]
MTSLIPVTTARGITRKVGFELEFAGIELKEAADIIQSVYGGRIMKGHRYHYEVADTEFGNFRVELDARILRRMANDDSLKKWGIDFKSKEGGISIEDMLDRLAKTVVPIEIVMPPVAMDQAQGLEPLRAALQERKAEGTGVSLIHAFGMHINIECPDTEVSTLLKYLRAFLLLYPWLLRELKINMTRKLSPFVDPFPETYVKKVLEPSYQPTKERFIDDYILHNATRNRPVDLMPVFAMTEPEKVQKALKDEKNKPRPAFHYRLPNSNIDDPDWRLMDELNYWMKVEKLTTMPQMMDKLSRLYLLRRKQVIVSFRKEWAETIAILLDLDE